MFGKVLGLGSGEDDTLTKLEKAKVKIDKKGRVVQPGAAGIRSKDQTEDDGGEDWERIGVESVTIHANPFAE